MGYPKMKKSLLLAIASVLISNLSVCHAGFDDYRITQLTFDAVDHESVSVSGFGEIIWAQKIDGHRQVFSLNRGQLTFDDWNHNMPDINSKGEIVYLKEMWGEAPQVYSSVRGRISEGKEVSNPRISDAGEIIWRERRAFDYIFCSDARGELTSKQSYDADITYDGEVIYTAKAGTNKIELFSPGKGQKTSGFSGGRPRANNRKEVIWEHDVIVGGIIYRQIFSDANGAITDFYKANNISIGDIDDDGVIYFTKRRGRYRQIFSAIPKKLVVAEAYEPPDTETFDKIDNLINAAELGLKIITPADGSTVSGNIRIKTNADDSNFSYDYALIGAEDTYWDYSSPYEFDIDTTTISNGTHTIEIHSWHKQAGQSMRDKITVHVSN